MSSIKQKVNIKLQLLSLILLITAIIGFSNIKKLKRGGLLMLGMIGVSTFSEMILPWPYGLLVGIAITYPVLAHYMLKWSRAWNEGIDKSMQPTGLE